MERKIQIRRKIEEPFFKPILASVEGMDKFEEKDEEQPPCKKILATVDE